MAVCEVCGNDYDIGYDVSADADRVVDNFMTNRQPSRMRSWSGPRAIPQRLAWHEQGLRAQG